MVRTIDGATQTAFEREAGYYTEIFQIYHDGSWFHFTPFKSPVSGTQTAFTIDGNVYVSMPSLARSQVKSTTGVESNSVTISIDNVSETFAAYVLTEDIQGDYVTISGFNLDSSTGLPIQDPLHIYSGYIGTVRFDDTKANFVINRNISSIRENSPTRFYDQATGFPFGKVVA